MNKITINWNSKQKEVIQSLVQHNRLFVEGGVRSGKSWVIAYMIDYICRKTPGMTALVLRKSYESIKTDTHIIFGKNPGFLTPDKGKWKDGGREFQYHQQYGGSTIYFRHAEGSEHLLGMTAGLIFFEQAELIREEDFDLIKNTRLSQWGGNNLITQSYLNRLGKGIEDGRYLPPRNYLFITANPKAGWVKSRYIDKDPMLEGIKHFHVSTYDNLENLAPEYLEQMSNASDQFKQRYFDGSWQFNSGLVYPEFNDANIVEPPFDLTMKFNAVKTFVAVDPGYARSKFAVLFAAVLPDGRIYVFDEVVKNGRKVEDWEKVGIPEIVAEMKSKYQKYGFVPTVGLIDPASNAKIAGMESVTMQFQKNNIILTNAKKPDEMDTVYRVKQLLKDRKIIVNSRCRNLLQEFGLFRWHEKKIDTMVDEDNDCLDCLRYIVNESPSPYFKEDIENPYANKDAIYRNWLRTWYGKEEKKKSVLSYTNNSKLDYGI